MLICSNLSRTLAIDVLFSVNFAVLFDFIYFRFRPGKAKWIGNVLPNRRNAANYLQRFFFWSSFVCSVISRFQIKVSSYLPPYIFLPLLTQQMTLRIAYSKYQCIFNNLLIRSALPTDARWIAASILKTERYFLRHYTDATMHLAPLGNAQQYCSVFSSQLVCGLFFIVRRTLPMNADWLGASIGNAHYKREKNIDLTAAFRLFGNGRTLPIHFALLGRKQKNIKSKKTTKL